MRTFRKHIFTVLSFIAFFGACFLFISQGPAELEPLYITDSLGSEFPLSELPERIISVAPSITETIFALGAQDLLVGRTDYCDYPPEVESIDSIGSLRNPNIERIIELEPDVVLAATHFKDDVAEILTDFNIPVLVFQNPESFEAVYSIIESIAQITATEDRAEQIVSGMKSTVTEVEMKVAGVQEKPSLYYIVGFGDYGDYTAGGDTFVGSLIRKAGGINIAEDLSGWAYSFEKIIEGDPDIIVCSAYYDTFETLQITDGYRELPAIVEGRMFEINNNLLDRPGPRLAEGLRKLSSILYPELY